jgi:hypothetical protein
MKLNGIEAIICLYIFSSIYVGVSSFIGGEFPKSAPFRGFRFEDSNLFLNLLLLSFFYFIFWAIFRKFKNSNKSIRCKIGNSNLFGLFTLVCQFVLLYFIISEGVLTASKANNKGASFARYFNAFFIPDYLFLVYYSFAKRHTLSFLNAGVYLFSTLVRGWGGGVLVILLFKVIEYFKKKYVVYIIVLIVIGAMIGPFVHKIRGEVRAQGFFNFADSQEVIGRTIEKAYFSSSVIDPALSVFSALFNRLSHLSSPVMISQNLDLFWLGSINGRFSPYYSEGKIQEYLTRHKYVKLPSLPEYLSIAFFPTPYGSWYIHPGLLGWFWVNPFYFPLVIGYSALLLFSNIYLMRKIGGGREAERVLFFLFLVFPMNGWFAPFSSCLQALILFWILRKTWKSFLFLKKIAINGVKYIS